MHTFPDTLCLEDAGMRRGSRVFRLQQPYRYISTLGTVTVPAGTETDGASVPRAFWTIFEPFGEYFPAAVIHDFLYTPDNHEFDRWESDIIFKEAMFNLGVPWTKREPIYHAVRIFGGRLFRGQPPHLF